MPIENERKFVLDEDGLLERQLMKLGGVARLVLRQAYLDSAGLRIRAVESPPGTTRYVFTYKRLVDEQMVEIETDIEKLDFERLWKIRNEALHKVRYAWDDDPFHWDVDFFKTEDDCTYFALAEVEMPEDETEPPGVPAVLRTHLVGLVAMGDPRFTSKRLANRTHAENLLADIRRIGRVP